jgi:hypothetical protein
LNLIRIETERLLRSAPEGFLADRQRGGWLLKSMAFTGSLLVLCWRSWFFSA